MIQHKHLIVRGNIERPPLKEDKFSIQMWTKKFITSNGMRLASEPVVEYIEDSGNRGLTCCCLLTTSHVAFHIWDEPIPALMQFDFYTCGKLDRQLVLKLLNIKFVLTKYEFIELDRGEKLSWSYNKSYIEPNEI